MFKRMRRRATRLEQHPRRWRPTPSALIACIALVAALTGVAIAAIPAADGTISACYVKRTGEVRIIDSSVTTDCGRDRAMLTWNQQGPQGPPGPPGKDGAPDPAATAFISNFGSGAGTTHQNSASEDCMLSQVILLAGSVLPKELVPAHGQAIPLNTNLPLFSLLGTVYGGDGTTTFQLPDMRAIEPNNMTYAICVAGRYP